MPRAATRELLEHSVRAYAGAVGSAAPAPGAGSVAALTAALAAALNEKVARKSPDPVTQQLAKTMARTRERLLNLVDDDARAFSDVMRAWKGTPLQRRRALKMATKIPLAVCSDCSMIHDVALRLAAVAKPAIRADAQAAQRLAVGALQAARLMVEVNLSLMDDAAFAQAAQEALNKYAQSCPPTS